MKLVNGSLHLSRQEVLEVAACQGMALDEEAISGFRPGGLPEGFFISFDGLVEERLLTRQADLLEGNLAEAGWTTSRAFYTREDRAFTACLDLLDEEAAQEAPLARGLVALAHKVHQAETFIRPGLAEGNVVVCDGHLPTLIAAPASRPNLEEGFLTIAEEALGDLQPALTIILLDDPASMGALTGSAEEDAKAHARLTALATKGSKKVERVIASLFTPTELENLIFNLAVAALFQEQPEVLSFRGAHAAQEAVAFAYALGAGGGLLAAEKEEATTPLPEVLTEVFVSDDHAVYLPRIVLTEG